MTKRQQALAKLATKRTNAVLKANCSGKLRDYDAIDKIDAAIAALTADAR